MKPRNEAWRRVSRRRLNRRQRRSPSRLFARCRQRRIGGRGLVAHFLASAPRGGARAPFGDPLPHLPEMNAPGINSALGKSRPKTWRQCVQVSAQQSNLPISSAPKHQTNQTSQRRSATPDPDRAQTLARIDWTDRPIGDLPGRTRHRDRTRRRTAYCSTARAHQVGTRRSRDLLYDYTGNR